MIKIGFFIGAKGWNEPTGRQRGIRVVDGLKKRGYDVEVTTGGGIYDIAVVLREIEGVDNVDAKRIIWDCNDAVFLKDNFSPRPVSYITVGSPRMISHLTKWYPRVIIRYMPEAIDPMYSGLGDIDYSRKQIIWMGMHDNIKFFDNYDVYLSKVIPEAWEVVFVCPPIDSTGVRNEDRVAKKPYNARYVEWSPETVTSEIMLSSIGAAPLELNEWCMCKSANKAGTFAWCGVPVVGTRIPTYDWLGVVTEVRYDKFAERIGDLIGSERKRLEIGLIHMADA